MNGHFLFSTRTKLLPGRNTKHVTEYKVFYENINLKSHQSCVFALINLNTSPLSVNKTMQNCQTNLKAINRLYSNTSIKPPITFNGHRLCTRNNINNITENITAKKERKKNVTYSRFQVFRDVQGLADPQLDDNYNRFV